jgi:peptide/nickel transport system substrate-binding protein
MSKNRNSWSVLFFLFLAVALIVTGCAGQTTNTPQVSPSESVATQPPAAQETPAGQPSVSSGQPTKGGTIRYVNLEPATLNPYLRPEQVAWQASVLVSTGLVDLDSKGEWVLELAQEFPSVDKGTLSSDGLTVTWKLRPGLKWSDGQPLTSDDLRFTWEVCSNPNSGCAINGGFSFIKSVDTPDDNTIVLHYSQIYPAWMAQFRAGVLPRHGTGKAEDMMKWDWNRTVNPTSGPFMVKQWTPSDSIIFERNPNYWEEGKPYLDQIIWQIVPDFEVQRQMLVGNQADLDVNVYDPALVKETHDKGFTMGGGTTPFWNRIQFNLWDPNDLTKPHPILGDVQVRKALLTALDVKTITANWNIPGLYNAKLGTSLYDLWPQFACNLPAYTYDPEKAKTMLDQAGWKDTNGDGVRECDGCTTAPKGTPMQLRISSYSNWGQEDFEVIMIDELKKVGVDARMQNYEATVMYSSWTDGSFMYRGDFDVLWWDHDPGMPDPQFRTESFYSADFIPSETNPTGMNMSRINDPDIEKWSKEAASTIDVATRKDAYCKIADKLLNGIASEQANGTLTNFAFSNPKLKGWSVNELYSPFGWDAEDWYLEN